MCPREQFVETTLGKFPPVPAMSDEARVALTRLPAALDEYLEQQRTHGHQVVTHGDLWSSNIMFNVTDAGAGDEVVALVDWQCCGLAPNMSDLPFLLLSSLEPDVRRKHTYDILRAYHGTLTTTSADGPTADTYPLEACVADYHRAIPLGVMQCLGSRSCFEHEDPERSVSVLLCAATCGHGGPCSCLQQSDNCAVVCEQAVLQRRLSNALADGTRMIRELDSEHDSDTRVGDGSGRAEACARGNVYV